MSLALTAMRATPYRRKSSSHDLASSRYSPCGRQPIGRRSVKSAPTSRGASPDSVNSRPSAGARHITLSFSSSLPKSRHAAITPQGDLLGANTVFRVFVLRKTGSTDPLRIEYLYNLQK